MLIGLIVVSLWKVCHFLYVLLVALYLEPLQVFLRWGVVVERTIDDESLTNGLRLGQIHGCFLVTVFQARSSSILKQDWNYSCFAFHGGIVKWGPPIMVDAVDVSLVQE